MYLSDLALNQFRSYDEVVLRLEPGVNVFVGENGRGKTNLIEAIGYLATFSSHRVGRDAALVKQGAEAAVIRAKVWHGESPTVLELEIVSGKANRGKINRGQVRPSQMLGILKTVLFAPEDLELVKGDPGRRRTFLDDLITQLRPGFLGVRSEYEKVLRQRSALLKSAAKIQRRGGSFDYSTLDVWDLQLAKLGAKIIVARMQLIRSLRPYVESYYRDVSGTTDVARIDYDVNLYRKAGIWNLPEPSSFIEEQQASENASRIADFELSTLQDVSAVEQLLLKTLGDNHDAEIARGLNLIGPHRDDLRLLLGSLPAKGYASHGESWSYALALRLASWRVLQDDDSDVWSDDGEPILILDDVFAELDARRRERLANIVVDAGQVLITAAVGDDLPPNLLGTRFRVERGAVSEIHAGKRD